MSEDASCSSAQVMKNAKFNRHFFSDVSEKATVEDSDLTFLSAYPK